MPEKIKEGFGSFVERSQQPAPVIYRFAFASDLRARIGKSGSPPQAISYNSQWI
jgi:hypothetical protein